MSLTQLVPHLRGFRIDAVTAAAERVVLAVSLIRRTAACPACQRRSTRVHSRYRRTLADLPLGGRPVVVQVRVRRYSCPSDACPQQIFAERLPALTTVRPDARLRYRIGDTVYDLLVEWDRGLMRRRDYDRKLSAYAAWAASMHDAGGPSLRVVLVTPPEASHRLIAAVDQTVRHFPELRRLIRGVVWGQPEDRHIAQIVCAAPAGTTATKASQFPPQPGDIPRRKHAHGCRSAPDRS